MVRNGGTKASTTLEDPSEEQYRKIQELAYIRSAGMETDFAATDAFFVYSVRQEGVGKPCRNRRIRIFMESIRRKKSEIMLPMRALKLLGG